MILFGYVERINESRWVKQMNSGENVGNGLAGRPSQ